MIKLNITKKSNLKNECNLWFMKNDQYVKPEILIKTFDLLKRKFFSKCSFGA